MPTYNLEKDSLGYRFHLDRHKIQIMGGGFGNGKTAALCVKAIRVATDYPGCNMLLARETFPKLNDTLRKEFYKWIPRTAVRRWPTKDDNTLYMHNGTTINFRYVSQRGKTSEDGSTTSNLLSATYDFVGIDQIEDPGIVEKDFFDIMGRLRGSTPYRGDDPTMPTSGPRWFIITCNPTSNWFYRKIIKPLHLYEDKGIISDDLMMDKATNKPVIKLFEGSTYENKANLPEDFIEGMEATYSGQMFDRFVMGKWAAYEGLVYPMFEEEHHCLPRNFLLKYLRETTDHELEAIEGYDFGMASPSCYLFGVVDALGRVIILDGFYKKEMPLDEQAAKITEIRAKYTGLCERKDRIIADPSIFKRSAVVGVKVGETVADIFRRDYNIGLRPGDNSITQGIPKVASYLKQYTTLPSLTKGEKSALIYFAEELDFIPEEFGAYFWRKNPLNEAEDKPQDRNDHSLDAIKYMLSYRPKPGQVIRKKKDKPPPWMFWSEAPDQEKVF